MPKQSSALSQSLLENGAQGRGPSTVPVVSAPTESVLRRFSASYDRHDTAGASPISVPYSRRSEDNPMVAASPLLGGPFSYLRRTNTKVNAQHPAPASYTEADVASSVSAGSFVSRVSMPTPVARSGSAALPGGGHGGEGAVQHWETFHSRPWHGRFDAVTGPLSGGGGLPDLEQLTSGAEARGPAAGDSPLATTKKKKGEGLMHVLLYGVINSIVGIPTMISFAAIIFQDKLYAPYLGQLAKMAFLASGVHQLVFTLCSTLPFAVGQVQDVGLIFLSAMATSIASTCIEQGYEDHEALERHC
eukprot:jgi/Botrbrau1/4610/Bobra.60_2s0095.1